MTFTNMGLVALDLRVLAEIHPEELDPATDTPLDEGPPEPEQEEMAEDAS